MKAAKHSFKRYLAYLLVCALVMSNISVTAYAADTTSVPNDEVNITQEETLSDPENDTSSASEIIEEENADSSDVEIFDEENDDPSAEQSLEDELIEDNPMETVSDDQESDISDAASENEGAGTDEDSIFTEDKTQMNPLPKKMPTTALAADRGTVEVPYINDLGGEASADATLLTGSETELGTGFYAVTDNVIFNHPVTVTGSATRIILCDGKTAAFSSISTTGNCQLRFYGQEKGSGSLTATNLTGGLISIYGGTISAGTMTATPLNMFDGTLSADALTVGWYADFTMSSHFFGGIVDVDKLTVQDHDFTIGTENTPSPTDSFCAGSYVIAQGLKLHFANTFTAAEPDGNGAYIRYSGDYDNSAAAALAGKTLRPYISFTVNWVVNDVTVETDTANNGSPASYDGDEPTKDPDEQYSYVFTGWSDGENTYGPDALPPVTADVTYTAVFSYSKWPVSYVDLDNQTQTVPNVTPITDSTTELNSGWYAVTESITNGNRIIVNGDVNLILCDGATLTAPEGIGVNGGQSLTIWGQMRGTGALLVDGGDVNMYYAGIGGDEDYASGVITINGGTVTAAGGQYAAGIGGSDRHNGSITINGGTVTATGGEYAACIGAGYNSDATVTINGGKVTANGAASGATGIGGGKGDGGSGSIITLSWTDATGGTMFVNSTSYNGSVTLQKAFMAGLTLYPAGAISDNSTLNGETLRPCTANIHKIEVACLRTDGKTASSTVTVDGEAPVGNVVTLTVNAAAGEKLTEQQKLSDFQLTNGFIAFYRDDNENIVFVTIDKSGNSYCFVMPDYDVTIYAVMEPIDYSIAFNEPIHGNTTVHKGDALEEISTAHAGDTINVLFSASSSNAYIVTEMTYTYTEDGEEKTGTMELTNPNDENVYFLGTFTMPASDVRISITYQGAYTITYEPSAGISLKQEKFSEVAGETVTLTPYDDYTVSSVSVKCGDEDIPVNTNASGTFSFTMPEGDVVVSAEYVYDFSYVNRYWNESTKSVESEVVDLAPSSLTLKQLTLGGSTIKLYYEGEGLIFFTRDLTFNDRYTISGNMKFIIADGVTVTFSKGIAVNNGATLSIYGQSSDSGKLIANSENYNAAIGSDDQDKDSGANGGGAINIHGGTILATAGSDAAGIGGGNEAGNGNITIYGGTVTAQGGQDAAGIGTGDEPETTAGDIRIYGGTVTAHSVGLGAGIGGGDAGKGGRIYIYGGTVNATGGTRGAGIGGGEGSVANTIQIDGGTVYASGGTYAAGIGTGYDPCNNNGRLESIVINGGNVNATSGYYAAAIGSGTDENITGGEITINGGTVRTCVLYDGGAGIGTGRNSHCGLNITINGGDVAVDHRNTTDEDGEGAAGIGSGYYGDCYEVTFVKR